MSSLAFLAAHKSPARGNSPPERRGGILTVLISFAECSKGSGVAGTGRCRRGPARQVVVQGFRCVGCNPLTLANELMHHHFTHGTETLARS